MHLKLSHKLEHFKHVFDLANLFNEHLNVVAVGDLLLPHAFRDTHGLEEVALHLVWNTQFHGLKHALNPVHQSQPKINQIRHFVQVLVAADIVKESFNVFFSQLDLVVHDCLEHAKLVKGM